MTTGSPEMAARAAADLEGSTPQEILQWALDRFHPRLAIASSMADAVVIDMASRIRSGVPVIFLDTGYHFAETMGTRDAIAHKYAADVLTVSPRRTVAEQDAEFGPKLHDRDPDSCCRMRKVEPLEIALGSYDAWASGIRREETDDRSSTSVVEWDAKREKVKVNPLAAWTQAQVDAYIEEHDVIVNPLLAAGYPSIGCAPCTRPVQESEDTRAGRWAGQGKSECGLHT